MSSLSTLPKGDSAWLLRKSIQRVMQQVSVLETNIGSSTTGNSANTQIIFNDAGTLRGDAQFTWNKTLNQLTVDGLATISGDLTVGTTLGVTGVTTLTGNAFANGSATVAAGTPGAFANAALTINNRGGVGDLSLIALGYRPNGTVLNGAGYIGFITTSGSGNVLGDLIFGTRSVTTDTAPTERYRIDSTGISTWSVAGSTAMTLNSTGLGVGVSPAFKIHANGVIGTTNTFGAFTALQTAGGTGYRWTLANDNNFYLQYSPDGFGSTATSRISLDSSGNVGIGVTPSAWGIGKVIQIGDTGGSFHYGANGQFISGVNAYYDTAWKYAANGFANYYQQSSGIHSWFTAASGTAGNAITWTQAMTLDASGNLLVGAASFAVNNGKLRIQHSGLAGEWGIQTKSSTTDGYVGVFYTTTGQAGFISVSGTSTTFSTTSDYRLKESVQPLIGGLARINNLKPSTYKWKADGSNSEGFIAHELAEVVPAAVTGQKDAVNADGSIKPQGVDLSKLVPILVAAIQELTARVQTLEAK